MRAFAAIDISEEVLRSIEELIGTLSEYTRKVRWCRPRQIHITLKFFEDLPEAKLEAAREALGSCARPVCPFEISVRDIGYFGQGDRMRVLWCGLSEPAGTLVALQKTIEEALVPLGFPKEGRPFKPHLTLGRFREPSREPRLAQAVLGLGDYRAGSFSADRLVLYQSTLMPQGPVYKVMGSWPMMGSP